MVAGVVEDVESAERARRPNSALNLQQHQPYHVETVGTDESDSHSVQNDHEAPPQSVNGTMASTSQRGSKLPTHLPPPPRSSRQVSLPLTLQQHHGSKSADPRLIHPILLKVPLQFRFGFTGALSNVIFMIAYNVSIQYNIHYASRRLAPSTIYAVLYLALIPLSHVLLSLLVFGWPEHYRKSLMSNVPIGLTAIALGSMLTAYLDEIDFNDAVSSFVRDNFTFSHMPPRSREEHEDYGRGAASSNDYDDGSGSNDGEFYSSLVVLFVTSVWTYVLSVWINASPAKLPSKIL